MRFGDAVENDPEADALVENFAIRFSRTMEIIFGEDDSRFDFLKLPARLGNAFDRTLR
jgi:hypothetical protein